MSWELHWHVALIAFFHVLRVCSSISTSGVSVLNIYSLEEFLIHCVNRFAYFYSLAFVYVGLYGYGYCEAGKSVIQLFKDRGWEAIIADDLVGMVLFMVSLIVGLLTGAGGILIEDKTEWFDSFQENGADLRLVVFILGLIIGLLLCSIVMSVIASSVNTAIVLFAEAPAEFEKNYPALSREMREAYLRAHPGCAIG